MPSTTLPSLSEDEIDDLLYFARTGELSDLKTSVEAFAKAANASQSDIIVAAVDSFSGNGPLHMASANGHLETLQYLLSLVSSATSEAHKSTLDAQNASGNTPLHWASLNGHLEAVKILVSAGADPSIVNSAGHDAVYEAEVNEKEKVAEWLLTEGKGLETGVGNGRDIGEGAVPGEEDEVTNLEEDVGNMDVSGKS
ncbi:hypothetical protein MMC24_006418 [Lignoscripta atroalba]|nr:hypothetical protein [Lignoscripta atroalba]